MQSRHLLFRSSRCACLKSHVLHCLHSNPTRCPCLQVVLRTTLGDIDIELWPKEAPKAVRNFVQLCLEGYYDGTIFHRIIKDFLAQGAQAGLAPVVWNCECCQACC